MYLSQFISTTLLASVLLPISFHCHLVHASPVFRRSSNPHVKRSHGNIITLPVKRYIHNAGDLHPLITVEQHVNRGVRRLARMTGGYEPPLEILRENLMRRVLEVEGPDGLEKRFNRRSLDDNVELTKRFNEYGVPDSRPQPAGNSLAEASGAGGDGEDGEGGEGLASQKLPVTPANPPTANNSLGLDIEGTDTAYLAKIQIGNPPRDFSILMDSGSADTWVGAEECKAIVGGGGCGDHIFLGPQTSSSFEDSETPFAIRYGTGNVSGTVVKDDMSIAGLTLTQHTFGVATVESPEFAANRIPFDGLMGLAQSKLSKQKTLTPPEALAKEGLISAAIVSYKLSRLEDNKNDGEITFGGLNPDKFDPNTLVTIENINTLGFWEAPIESISIDGQPLSESNNNNNNNNNAPRTAILDTGTTLAILPQADAIAIHNQIPGSTTLPGGSSFTVPCNTSTVISLTFGGREFEVDSRDLAFVPLGNGGAGGAGAGDVNGDGEGDCISGIAAGNFGEPTQWLVGATFLKNTYLSTDFDKNTLSLAKLV